MSLTPFSLMWVVSVVLLFSTSLVGQKNPVQGAPSPDPVLRRADQLYDAGNYAGAISLYRPAAVAGNPHAMTQLGLCYDLGNGVPADSVEAMRWYRKAADAGDLTAMAYIGGMYSDGSGVPISYPQALAWYHKSADAGGTAGMNKLGLAYEGGLGVPKNPAIALQWYLKAANLGDRYAMINLSKMYIGRSGIPQDVHQTLRWDQKAADLGDSNAMNTLATIYEAGWKDIPRDSKKADYWYTKAAALGNENARESLMRLGGWQNFDLNGDWEAYFNSPALPEAIRIVQQHDTLQATRLREDLLPLGIAFLRARYDRGKNQSSAELATISFPALIIALNASPGASAGLSGNWGPTTITILDPDHFIVGDRPPFQRVTTPRLNDVPCSPQNPLRVQPLWAYIRGKMAVEVRKYDLAACWYHIGIVGGQVRARSGMGDLLRYGWGTPRNASWAYSWYEGAAQQGDPYAAKSIADMYDRGELPANPAKSQQWHAKAKLMEERYNKALSDEKKKEQSNRASMHLLAGIALVGGQLLTWDVGADPGCDVRRRDIRTGNPIEDSVDPEREATRNRMVANGEMYCGKPIDISPLFPEH